MKKELFTELLESVREGGMILRGEQVSSRTFTAEASQVTHQSPLTYGTDAIERKKFDAEFESEIANFERLRPELLMQYPNQVVAIYQAKVIAHGDDILQVYNTVVDKYGAIPCYVQRVTPETPRERKLPTTWKVK